ncbi:carbohydrate porin [Oscillatoria sp. FACHB-1406]|nr:carbohydrate porin [Oscillatoria sp. FACHB-1406]
MLFLTSWVTIPDRVRAIPPAENAPEIPSQSFPEVGSAPLPESELQVQMLPAAQFRDVQPTDWAFEALQSLQQRYDCLAGYPDRTYRGDRPLTRYEFAAGLNACLTKLEEFLQKGQLATQEDLETVRRLQQDFATELATLKGRMDNLETRTQALEDNAFSTTTKLSGLVVMGVQGRTDSTADIDPRDGIKDTPDRADNINTISFASLYLTTNFSPRSYLATGLFAGIGTTRFDPANALKNDGYLAYDLPSNSDLTISDLHFHWLLADNLGLMVGTEGVNIINAFRGPNRYASAATGNPSYFAQRNPVLNIGGYFGKGLALDWQIAKQVSLQALYQSSNLGRYGLRERGLFDGNTTAAVQLLLTPADPLDLALYYVNNYSFDGCLFTLVGDDCLNAGNRPMQTHAIGATLNWQISPQVTMGAWGGYTTSSIPGESGSVQTTNYMVYLNLPDLLSEGNLGGISIGQPPKIVSSTLPAGNNIPAMLGQPNSSGGQPGTTLQLEAFYRMRLSDNLSITPGIIHIFNPRHTPDSEPVTIFLLRSSIFF